MMLNKFGAMLPELDKLKQEHDAIMQALQSAQSIPVAAQITPQATINGQGV